MAYALKPHQVVGRDTLVARARLPEEYIRHFILADEQRVGKCAQGLTAAAELGVRRVAVLCKAIGRDNWIEQHDIWTPDRPFKLWVESYNRYTRNADVQASLRQFKPDILILDEAQWIRNQDSKSTMLLYGDNCEGDGDVSHAGLVWIMSGTLAPNNAGELWTHLYALWEWPYDYREHIDRYTRWSMGDYGPRFWGLNEEHAPELKRFLRKISLRRLFSEVNPASGKPVWQHVTLTPKASLAAIHRLEKNPAVRRVLDRIIAREEFPETEEGEAAEKALDDTPLATLLRLIGEAKAPLAVEHVRDMLDDRQAEHVLLGAWHHPVLDALERGLKKAKLRVLRVDGKTPQPKRMAMQKAWLRGEADVFLGQLAACGTSIDLSRADCVVFAESSWAPDDNLQFVMRANNLAKQTPLPVDVLGLANSTDVGVQNVNARKGEQSSQLWEDEAA